MGGEKDVSLAAFHGTGAERLGAPRRGTELRLSFASLVRIVIARRCIRADESAGLSQSLLFRLLPGRVWLRMKEGRALILMYTAEDRSTD